MVRDLILKNRSYRRYDENEKIEMDTLKELIELARITPVAANKQHFKYILSNTKDKNEKIFKHLSWAAYLTDWKGPEQGERPSAYIIMLQDKRIFEKLFWGQGNASQSILLGAVEKGYGGCMFGAINREGLIRELSIPDHFEIIMVISLGKPSEEVVLEEIDESGDIKYWRDEKGVHHVPKRKLEDLILDI
jgi:nitroreductase